LLEVTAEHLAQIQYLAPLHLLAAVVAQEH
jgi:hypothetical protein